ncbi:sulfurtransferase [Tahibacter amnicola]|uniref:Sulfurtransferase n=1 Tax=Tahibacter amnicola TaxID=2976241 RepID=A0ABY6BH59_9GAMM|nr:sulfurtransferase [Tahibacter amnicola]UXI67197.1 sulfurtransferase [Tahibacter amnicola]
MNYQTLISARELAALLDDPELLLVDCRFELSDTTKGERAWRESHLPGAYYAHLDRDLSDLSQRHLGRHPLPSPAQFAACLSRWGWSQGRQVVVYDDANGSVAARLWWMFRLIGHKDVAVLDGGYAGWVAGDLPLSTEPPLESACPVDLAFDMTQVVYFEELSAGLAERNLLLIDVRGAPRFRGEVEPIDPVAGHIPGAVNRPFVENVDAEGRFRHADELREDFERLTKGFTPDQVVHSCGSGVTACHNVLAMEHAGLAGSRVFAPSWSGWIADRSRPVATGN